MKDMTQGSEAKHILLFALPMLLGNLFQALYNTVDSIWVGQIVGSKGLAAVAVSFPIIFMLISLVMGLTMGTTIIISQYYGAKDMDNVKKTIDNTLLMLIVASILTTIIGLIFSKPILVLIDTPAEILKDSIVYLNIMFGGMIFLYGYNGLSAILRGMGDSKTPLYFLIIATVVNIILDPIFIYILKLGVAGAAYATVISQAISFVLGYIYLYRKHEIFRAKLNELRFDSQIMKLIFKIGFPMAIQQTLVSVAGVFLNAIINRFGANAMAAFGAASRVESFVFMPSMSIAMSVSSFTGQNLGAKKLDRVKRGFKAALLIGLVISIFTLFITLGIPKYLIMMFIKDKEVIALGVQYLKILGMFYFAFTFMFVANGVVRGSGDTFVAMLITLVALWFVRIPLANILSKSMGLVGVWYSIGIGFLVGMTLSFSYYFSGRWKTKAIVK
ncbi:Multidrug export protein MepA [Caloramator mitchellensis]|uniref:Probable multidrug resistance protein NorM n=2 Tax=Caloramator mitchellensis TaxID=908809 RepID=A0A0R3JS41_CALMK|nr:Multidrug export protein MepA [Caloramator mitchellensis]